MRLSPVLEVFSEVEGEVYADAEAFAVGPGRSATVYVGSGDRRLTFRRGADTVRTPAVDGPAVRLDPYLRAAGLTPTPLLVRTAVVDAEPGVDAAAGGWVGSTRYWPAVRRSGAGAVRWEAGGWPGTGSWVMVFRTPQGDVRLGITESRDADAVTRVVPEPPPTQRLAVGVEGTVAVPVEVVLVVDEIVTDLVVARGWAGDGGALDVPADFGPGVALAARLGGEAAWAGRTFVLPRKAGSVLLPAPESGLAPMAPEPRPMPSEARPVTGTPGTVYWTPPAEAGLWGVALADADGCVPGRHVAFARTDEAAVEVPVLLRDASMLSGVIGAWFLGASLSAFDATGAPPPDLFGPVGFAGRRGFVRGSSDGCPADAQRAGTYAVFGADTEPCAGDGPLGTLAVDTCGRTSAPLALAPAGTSGDPLRCGDWRGDVLTDAEGRAFRVRERLLDDGRTAFRVDHPEGDRWLVPIVEPSGGGLPAGLSRGRWRGADVTTHLERADFPGVPLLGTQVRLEPDAAGTTGEAEIGADGRLRLRWPDALRIGRLASEGTEGPPWAVRPWFDACPALAATATLDAAATADLDTLVYVEVAPGPTVLDGPTNRVLRARFWR